MNVYTHQEANAFAKRGYEHLGQLDACIQKGSLCHVQAVQVGGCKRMNYSCAFHHAPFTQLWLSKAPSSRSHQLIVQSRQQLIVNGADQESSPNTECSHLGKYAAKSQLTNRESGDSKEALRPSRRSSTQTRTSRERQRTPKIRARNMDCANTSGTPEDLRYPA